jgi:hypothetical protein
MKSVDPSNWEDIRQEVENTILPYHIQFKIKRDGELYLKNSEDRLLE